jgi:restriction endonuclease S subunit
VNAPAYPKTKKSGVEWLGDVPEHWEVRRLKFSVRTNPVKSEINELSGDTEVSFVPMDAVGELGGMTLEKEKMLNEVYTGYTYFADGDVVIAKITPCFENGKGAIAGGLKNGIGFGTTEFHVLRAEESCDRRFLFYLTISHPFRKIGASEMLGAGGQKRVPEEFIKNLRLGIPPIFEQQAIVEFLDRKTGRIDELIGKKKELIKKLNEQRSALITSAVTGKLQSRTGFQPVQDSQDGCPTLGKMKNSGVEWLGQIPEHWNVRRLKFAVSCNDETLPEDTDPGKKIEYVDISSVSLAEGVTSTETFEFEKAPSRARRKVRDGDTIVSTVRTYLKAIAPINNSPENLVVSTGFAVIRPLAACRAIKSYVNSDLNF